MIYVGSYALSKHTNLDCSKSDIDVVATQKIEGFDTIVLPQEIIDLIPHNNGVATLDALYTLKLSHMAWNIKWVKHARYIAAMKRIGANKIKPLYDVLVQHWKLVHGNKFISLNKSKDEFFDDKVVKVYDHDHLHEMVSYPNKPLYTKCLKDNCEVMLDKNKFDALEYNDKLRMFKEEMVVIACERWILNPLSKVDCLYRAYCLAVQKTITNLTKGWATEFILDNFEFYSKFDKTYFTHIVTLRGEKMIDVNEFLATLSDLFFKSFGKKAIGIAELIFNDYEGVKVVAHGDCQFQWDYYDYIVLLVEGQHYKVLYETSSQEGFDEICYVQKVKPVTVTTTNYEVMQ